MVAIIRGMRLRQLLMDLVKIGKRVQSPDSLISYEVRLSSWFLYISSLFCVLNSLH